MNMKKIAVVLLLGSLGAHACADTAETENILVKTYECAPVPVRNSINVICG